MKIVAIQDHLRRGGTEAQFLELTRRWRRAGHEVVRMVFRRGGGLLEEGADGVPITFLQPFPSPWNWWAPGLAAGLRKAVPDRVVCFGRNAHWCLARALPRGAGIGLMATLRGARKIPEGYARILRSAEQTVVNSGFARDRAIATGVPVARVALIENGCRLAGRPLPDRRKARERLGAGEGDTVLLCMGSFVPGKAQERLLYLWALLPETVRRKTCLWFVGDGPRRAHLRKQARNLPDSERVRFAGESASPESFFAAADATVSVSREESSPNALVESLWFGVPVFALSAAGIPELVTEGRDGFVFPDSDDGLNTMAARLCDLVSGGREGLGLDGMIGEESRHRFDPEARASDYLELFKEMGKFDPSKSETER